MKTVDLVRSKSKWSLDEKLYRLAWEIVRFALWPNQFRCMSPLRILLLRIFGARIESPCLIMDHVKVWVPRNLHMEECSTLGSYVEVYNFGIVSIGSDTVISQETMLCTASHNYRKSDMPLTWAPI